MGEMDALIVSGKLGILDLELLCSWGVLGLGTMCCKSVVPDM